MNIYDKDPIIGLKKDILDKISDNKKNNKPEIEINEEDTFDNVVNKYDLKNRQRESKKDILLSNPETLNLYNQLKEKPFSLVRKIYLTKDSLIDDKKQDEDDKNKKGSKRDNLIKHLFKIQNCIYLYKENRFNEFIKSTDYRYRITSIKDKEELKANIESLTNVGDKTIEEVIREADEKGICKIDDKLDNFKRDNEYLYNRVKNVKFEEFQKLYDYLEGYTPFSTQHKTKGSEYNNVLIILDNGGWNSSYNFEKMFLNTATPSVLENTQKLFYVCCTRAKENLAIFFHKPEEQVINKAKEWFGEGNTICIPSL